MQVVYIHKHCYNIQTEYTFAPWELWCAGNRSVCNMYAHILLCT